MPGDGQVSALTAGDTLLAHFWDLASLEEDVREKAASALVEALVANQAEFEAESGAEASDEEEANGSAGGGGKAREVARALRRCSPLMIYAFKRLCRGLGSSRQGARQGFSLAIASLLGAAQCIGPAEAVTAIEGVLEPVGKGSELRDALLGRIFGYAAVIRSGRPLPAALASSLAAGLVGAAAKKSFLREVAGAVLLELCTAVDASTLAGLVEGAAAPLAPWLTALPADSSPEALLLALHLWPRLPAAAAAACPLLPAGFKAKQLPAALFTDPAAAAGSKAVAAAAAAFFTKQHLTALLPVLRATTAAHPRLHSVWPTLLALLIPGFSADKEQRDTGAKAPARPAAAPLEAFWSTVVDGDLVASSHERKYLAFTLFQLLLPHLGPDQVSIVFTPAFLRGLATNLKKGDSYLHATAKKCAERISSFCDRTPEVRIAVALALQRHGGAELERYATGGTGKDKKGDKAEKSKAAVADGGKEAGKEAAADGAAAAEGLQQYVRQLQDAFLSGGASEGAAGGEAGESAGQQQRQWAVEQLCSVLKQRAAPAAVKLEVLRFLAVHALFSLDAAAAKKSKDAEVKAAAARSVDVPLPLRQLCAARLITLADSLDKQQQQHPGQQQQGGKGGKGGVPDAQQQKEQQQAPRQEFLGSVAALVGKLQQSGAATLATAAEGGEAAAEAAETAAATLQATLARMQSRMAAGGGTPAEQQRLRALTHLLRLLLLHTLADPASADAALAADLDTVELVAIEGQAAPQRAAKAGGGSGGGSEDEEEGSEEEQEEGAEAGHPPHWHDTLMDVLLALLARNAAPLPSAPLRDAVEHAFRAFADGLTATGMGDMLRVLARPLDSSAQEDGDVYASSDEEEEEMEVDGEEEEEEEGSEEEGSEEEEQQQPKAAKGAAAAAAKQAGSGSEEEGASSEDEDAMTDEAMFRMDSKLASYFATLKEGKGGAARAARDELVNFKMRVAGLVEAFCKRVPASPLLPGAIPPLLAGLAGASRPGGHQALAERLSGLITNKLCGCKAEAAGAGLEAAALEQQLRRCLYLASRSTDKRVASAAWAAYVFLQRAAAGGAAPADCRAKGEESAKAAAADFFGKKKSRLQRGQLEGLARRVPTLLPALLPGVLKAAAAARNEHLRVEAFHLLAAALKSAGGGAPKSLSGCGPALAAATLAAVKGPFAKPQRHVEALKLACQALESGGGAKLPAGKGGWQDVKAAAAAAQDDAGDNPKLCAALTRLEGLLEGAPAEQQQGGKRGKAAAAAAPKGGPAKKKQKS